MPCSFLYFVIGTMQSLGDHAQKNLLENEKPLEVKELSQLKSSSQPTPSQPDQNCPYEPSPHYQTAESWTKKQLFWVTKFCGNLLFIKN